MLPSSSGDGSRRLPMDPPTALSINFEDTTGGAALERMDTTETPALETNRRAKLVEKNTIVLKSHDGDGYVLPFLPWDSTKIQIEEIYRLRHPEHLADAIKDGNFDILDEDRNIILPNLWEQIVRPHAILQVSLPSGILDSNITSRYPYMEEIGHKHPQHSPAAVLPDEDTVDHEVLDVGEGVTESVDDGSEIDDGSELDSISSGSEGFDSSGQEEILDEPIRQVMVPTDEDGNKIVFQVDTAFPGPAPQVWASTDVSNQVKKRDPQELPGNTEHMTISKAISAQSDGRTSLQIYVLPGPRTPLTDPDIHIRWVHLHSERLDFASFKNTCLDIPELSERLRKLAKHLLAKVEKDMLKVFLGGMFIEPGTVLRADEKQQPDPQSVIFSCIPYFSLHSPAKKTPAGITWFSSRTLMQSYYPYEPVQERDAEQAYRLFGNEQHTALVHVPNMWMLNIGHKVVTTCGHEPLSKELVQSIAVIEESSLREKGGQNGDVSTATIRLRDWDHRKLLYTLNECRSFFQMEQRLRELEWCSARSQPKKDLQLSWHTSTGTVKVTPGVWSGTIKQRDSIFIDLSLPSVWTDHSQVGAQLQSISPILPPLSPFFCWPQTLDLEKIRKNVPVSDYIKRIAKCLDDVEKAMLSAVLSNYGSYSAVEEAFTTTAYYLGIPEETDERVKKTLEALILIHEKLKSRTPHLAAVHEEVVHRQQKIIAKCTLDLYDTMQRTLVLFVGDFDKSTMLRKLWGSVNSIGSIASHACEKLPVKNNDSAMTDTVQSSHSWFVRPDIDNPSLSASSSRLKRTFERCSKCSSNTVYDSPEAALSHLNKHLRSLESAITDPIRPEQWLASIRQKELELSLEGMGKIVTFACQTAQQLFLQAKELADGVRNEDGLMSTLYAFPRSLLSAFRQLLVFCFAIERSLFFTNKALDDRRLMNETTEYIATLPFSPEGLQVIEKFGNGVQQAILAAREELCFMVKSKEPVDIFKRLSLNPEYVCGWLMRRLLVKPLEKSMTVSDMYREYLSTIQFQVNHRPSKRLLRSINLLREEIAALQEVNTQQSKLVSKYMSVLDDTTYEKDIPSRRAMFPYERLLLESCQDSLKMTDQEYRYLLARCGPLSDSTKQSLEINEEDHGKAIMVFTIVTVIFLPLSFVTSFLGMNTTDIRDMGSSSTLFWTIAIPLTAVIMGSVLYIGYNGDDLRDAFDSAYRAVTGKQDRNTSARGISVAQRKLARKTSARTKNTLDFSSLADEAEFANPRPDDYYSTAWRGGNHYPRRQHTSDVPIMHWQPYASVADPVVPEPRTGLRTEPLKYTDYAPAPNVAVYNTARLERPEARTYHETITLDDRHTRRQYSPPTMPPPPPPPVERRKEEEWYSSARPIERTRARRHVPLATYEWTTKSHKRHQVPREGRRPRRDDPNILSDAEATQFRHVPANRDRYEW